MLFATQAKQHRACCTDRLGSRSRLATGKHQPAGMCQHVTVHGAATCSHAHTHAAGSLLEWATAQATSSLKCQVQHGARGRGLVAVQDIQAGEMILSVPLQRVYSSNPTAHTRLHWSAELAARLLRDRADCNRQQQMQAPRSSAQAQLDSTSWCTWLHSLPPSVVTPLQFTESELTAIGDPVVMEEVKGMQACIRACYEELEPELQGLGYGWADFLAAVQVLHSRCFYDPSCGCHLAVPGVDMANHDSVSPNAQVAIQHSPGAVQGWDAVDEVCDPDTLPPPQPSTFNLVAGAQTIRAGSEITISYGEWPDLPFFLLFGFLPEINPHNACILFPSLSHIVQLCIQLARKEAAGSEADEAAWVAAASEVAERLGVQQQLGGQFLVRADGWDGRLADAVALVHQAIREAHQSTGRTTELPEALPGVQQLVAAAVEDKLGCLRVAEVQAPADDAAGASDAMRLATAFRARQLAVLLAAAASLGLAL